MTPFDRLQYEKTFNNKAHTKFRKSVKRRHMPYYRSSSTWCSIHLERMYLQGWSGVSPFSASWPRKGRGL